MHPIEDVSAPPTERPDAAVPTPNDLHFTEQDFQWLRKVASEHSGIVLTDAKRNMIYSRLAKRLRHLGLRKFSDYRMVLKRGDEREFNEFINALTTNLTAFFRETHHFEHLRESRFLNSGKIIERVSLSASGPPAAPPARNHIRFRW